MSESKKISIIIPVYNRRDLLGRTIDSIYKQTYSNYEVIVVDDCSTENIEDSLDKKKITYLRNKKNIGPGGSRNNGAEIASGDIYLFTDSDILLKKDTLEKVAKRFEDQSIDGVVGLLGPDIEFPNFSSQYKNLYMHYTYTKFKDQAGVFFTSIAAARAEVFEDIGGFDKDFGIIPSEDLEICMRMREKYNIIFAREIEVEHVKYYSFSSLVKTDFDRASSLIRLFIRRKGEKTSRQNKEKNISFTPISFLLGLSFTAFAFLSIVLGIIDLRIMILAPLFLMASWLLNFPFLGFLFKKTRWGFFLKSTLFLSIDLFVFGLGIIEGLIGYAFGKKY